MRQNKSSKVKGYRHLTRLRERHQGKSIVFSSGGFDLTHPGHVLFFEDCRKHGDILVVGIGGDAARKKEKGVGRPILNEHVRLKMVSSLKPVDHAFIIKDRSGGHQLDPLHDVFAALRPDVYVINSDASHIPYRKAMIEGSGIQMVILKRWCPPEFEDISTTKLIEKIKKLK